MTYAAARAALLLSLAAVAGCTPADARTPSHQAGEPDRMGKVPVFEYHVIGPGSTEFHRSVEGFKADLELLYRRGYRPVTVAEMHGRRIDRVVPRGYKPFVAVFDDASASQFRYREGAGGKLTIDPTSAVGIWTEFTRTHPGWRNAATFCVLSAASGGNAFFGNGNIQGQKTAWRFPKIQYLVRNGFEICNHTLWHARLDRYSDAVVQEQIARLALAVDSAVPGYRIQTFALPLGIWPKNRSLAVRGSWRDPRTGRVVRYEHAAVLEVSGGPSVSPFDPRYNAHSIDRVIAHGNAVRNTVERLDRERAAYVSAGR